jgi:RNA polymerase sigma-70 factor (ECF subfamily)
LPDRSKSTRAKSADVARLLHLYVDRFNQHDWDGLRELIAADARLRVADRFAGRLVDSPYFGRYESWPVPWRMAAGEIDGEPAVIILLRDQNGWTARSIVHLDVTDGHIVRIADYPHCPWILTAAASFDVVDAGEP